MTNGVKNVLTDKSAIPHLYEEAIQISNAFLKNWVNFSLPHFESSSYILDTRALADDFCKDSSPSLWLVLCSLNDVLQRAIIDSDKVPLDNFFAPRLTHQYSQHV